MLLAVGLTSNMWIWSTKTFQSWRDFYRKRCARKRQGNPLRKSLSQPTITELRKQFEIESRTNGRVANSAIFLMHLTRPSLIHKAPQQLAHRCLVPSPSLPQSKASSCGGYRNSMISLTGSIFRLTLRENKNTAADGFSEGLFP